MLEEDVGKKKQELSDTLDAIKPQLENRITKADLSQIKSFAKPPEIVNNVLTGVYILLDGRPSDLVWQILKKIKL